MEMYIYICIVPYRFAEKGVLVDWENWVLFFLHTYVGSKKKKSWARVQKRRQEIAQGPKRSRCPGPLPSVFESFEWKWATCTARTSGFSAPQRVAKTATGAVAMLRRHYPKGGFLWWIEKSRERLWMVRVTWTNGSKYRTVSHLNDGINSPLCPFV